MNKLHCFGLGLFLVVSSTVAAMEQQIEINVIEKKVQPAQEISTTPTIISPAIPQDKYNKRCMEAYKWENIGETVSNAKVKLIKNVINLNEINELSTILKNRNADPNNPREKYLRSRFFGQAIGLGFCIFCCCPCFVLAAIAAGAEED